MIYITGACWGKTLKQVRKYGWGRMWNRDPITPYEGEPWGFDNEAYSYYLAGKSFDERRYLRQLEKAMERPMPYLAVVPDKVGAGAESLDFSLRWRERLPDEWPWYLVLQDGMEPEAVASHLDSFVGLFLGGTDAFKRQAQEWSDFSKKHGMLYHYGRAGTPYKVRHAQRVGADSADSALPLRHPDFAAEIRDILSTPERAYDIGPLFGETSLYHVH